MYVSIASNYWQRSSRVHAHVHVHVYAIHVHCKYGKFEGDLRTVSIATQAHTK